MKDKEIDDILKRAAEAPNPVDPALLDRVVAAVQPSLGPVRPLPPAWLLAGGMALIVAAVAVAGAAKLGLGGVANLTGLERALIFPTLAILTGLAATALAGEMVPGSRRRMAPSALLGLTTLALLAVFAALFHDYQTDHFVPQGIPCLTAGLAFAVPVAFAAWLLLRRGFAVNPVAAGTAAGTLAGLAGVAMLELHCTNFQAPHVMVWHAAVLLVSGAAGALAGWLASLRR